MGVVNYPLKLQINFQIKMNNLKVNNLKVNY